MNVTGKLHFPICREINTKGILIDSVEGEIKKLEEERRQKLLAIRLDSSRQYQSLIHKADSAKRLILLRNIRNDTIALLELTHQIDTIRTDTALLVRLSDSATTLSKKIRQYYTDSVTLRNKIDSLDTLLRHELTKMDLVNTQIYFLNKTYDIKRDALEMTVRVNESKFSWLTLVGNYERKKYYTLYDPLPFSEHFKENKASTYYFGFEFNFVTFSPANYPEGSRHGNKERYARPHVGNIGIVRLLSNDMDDFSTTELSESKKYVSGDSTRVLSTKYNVYTDTITQYDAWKVYVNYYYSFGTMRNFSFHLFPDVEFRDTDKTPFNVGIGLIFSLKKKDNSALNIELYSQFKDIGKALPQEEKKAWNRNEIGLKIGIPVVSPIINK